MSFYKDFLLIGFLSRHWDFYLMFYFYFLFIFHNVGFFFIKDTYLNGKNRSLKCHKRMNMINKTRYI